MNTGINLSVCAPQGRVGRGLATNEIGLDSLHSGVIQRCDYDSSLIYGNLLSSPGGNRRIIDGRPHIEGGNYIDHSVAADIYAEWALGDITYPYAIGRVFRSDATVDAGSECVIGIGRSSTSTIYDGILLTSAGAISISRRNGGTNLSLATGVNFDADEWNLAIVILESATQTNFFYNGQYSALAAHASVAESTSRTLLLGRLISNTSTAYYRADGSVGFFLDGLPTEDQLQNIYETLMRNKGGAVDIPLLDANGRLIWCNERDGSLLFDSANPLSDQTSAVIQNYTASCRAVDASVPKQVANDQGCSLSYLYDGSSDYHATTEIVDADGYQLEVWVTPGGTSGYDLIGAWEDSTSNRSYVGTDSSMLPTAGHKNATVTGSTTLVEGSFYKIKSVTDGNDVELFLDEGSGFASEGTATATGGTASDIPLWVGAMNDLIGGAYFVTGTIHRVIVRDSSGATVYDTIDDGFGTPTDAPTPILIPLNQVSKQAGTIEDIAGKTPDFLGSAPRDVILQNSNWLNLNTNQDIAVDHLAGTESITSHDGTATLSISAGLIDVTGAGTVGNILIDDGTLIPCAEGNGSLLLLVGGPADGAIATIANYAGSVWVAGNDDTARNAAEGFSFVRVFEVGDGKGIDVPISGIIDATAKRFYIVSHIAFSSPATTNQFIVDCSNTSGSNRFIFGLGFVTAGKLGIYTEGGGTPGSVEFGAAITDNQLHKVEFELYDDGGTLTGKVTLDDVVLDTLAMSATSLDWADFDELALGARFNFSTSQFAGLFCCIGCGNSPDNIEHQWQLDESYREFKAVDSVGTSHGVYYGATGTGDDVARIPANGTSGELLDAFGMALSNPGVNRRSDGVTHNESESTEDWGGQDYLDAASEAPYSEEYEGHVEFDGSSTVQIATLPSWLASSKSLTIEVEFRTASTVVDEPILGYNGTSSDNSVRLEAGYFRVRPVSASPAWSMSSLSADESDWIPGHWYRALITMPDDASAILTSLYNLTTGVALWENEAPTSGTFVGGETLNLDLFGGTGTGAKFTGDMRNVRWLKGDAEIVRCPMNGTIKNYGSGNDSYDTSVYAGTPAFPRTNSPTARVFEPYELVLNPEFVIDDAWDLGGGSWTIADDEATSGASSGDARQDLGLTAGDVVEWEIEYGGSSGAGSMQLYVGSGGAADVVIQTNTPGTYSGTHVTTGGGGADGYVLLNALSSSLDHVVTRVSVRRVNPVDLPRYVQTSEDGEKRHISYTPKPKYR